MKGAPIPGLRVRLIDEENKISDEKIKHAITAENGVFSILTQKSDFADFGKKLPELHIRVEDKKGNQLLLSKNKVRFTPGKGAYFEIIIPGK